MGVFCTCGGALGGALVLLSYGQGGMARRQYEEGWELSTSKDATW